VSSYGDGKSDGRRFGPRTCAVCGRRTEMGIAFQGEAEWVIAGMVQLGIPGDQAAVMVTDITRCDPGKVPVGRFTLPMRTCATCAARIPGLVPMPLDGGQLPCVTQPPE